MWDVLGGDLPRHLDLVGTDRQIDTIIAIGLLGLSQWHALPPTGWDGGAGIFASGTRRISLDVEAGEVATLPTVRTEHGSHRLDAQVGGIPVAFWVDTGAPISVLTRSTARRLGIEDDVRYTRLDRFEARSW